MHIKWLELILVSGVALGIAFWQLYDVNKAIKADKENRPSSGSDTAYQVKDSDDSGPQASDKITKMREQGD